MKARFDRLEELDLVDCKKFAKMSAKFDDHKLKSLSRYAKFFDLIRLKSDLEGLYCSQRV